MKLDANLTKQLNFDKIPPNSPGVTSDLNMWFMTLRFYFILLHIYLVMP